MERIEVVLVINYKKLKRKSFMNRIIDKKNQIINSSTITLKKYKTEVIKKLKNNLNIFFSIMCLTTIFKSNYRC